MRWNLLLQLGPTDDRQDVERDRFLDREAAFAVRSGDRAGGRGGLRLDRIGRVERLAEESPRPDLVPPGPGRPSLSLALVRTPSTVAVIGERSTTPFQNRSASALTASAAWLTSLTGTSCLAANGQAGTWRPAGHLTVG